MGIKKIKKIMGIKRALLLSAGMGTRMGNIGKVLPKVLMPIFEKTLLELQIQFLKSIGIDEIYINVHHQADMIENFVNHYLTSTIHVIRESTLLDIGGAIHNIAQLKTVNYQDHLLVVNSDQFLFVDKNILFSLAKRVIEDDFTAALIPLKVFKGDGDNYNGLLLNNENLLKEIKIAGEGLEDTNGSYYTYSGTSIINLNKIKKYKSSTPSKFFETVANYRDDTMKILVPVDHGNFEYWDFGTTKRYSNSIFNLLDSVIKENKKSFVSFCIENGVFDFKKVNFSKESKQSYGLTDRERTINLSKNFFSKKEFQLGDEKRVVLLNELDDKIKIDKSAIYYRNLYDII
ncbi:MAG: NTP transferase domain-containing protein [Oligoflexia bacterium]|nr:NTP transferase domain-containing protein [Oligoflexia bacterium]